MTQIIRNWWWWGWSSKDAMLKTVYDPNNIGKDAFDYDNFINTPEIPAAQVQSDWNEADNSKVDYIKNKPSIPTKTSDLNNDSWFITKDVDNLTNYKKTSDLPDFTTYQLKSNMVTSLNSADNDHYPTALAVKDAISSSWWGDVSWPASSVDGHLAVFDWATGKVIKDWNKKISDLQNTFIITEADVTVSTSEDMWVAPYNTSYKYTNIDITNPNIEWKEWAIYTFVVDTEMVVASAYRNVRVKIWNGAYIPVMWTTAALAWSSYFTKTNIRQYQYTTKYESWWALHLFTDANTTYKTMTAAQATAWTSTTGLLISPKVLQDKINEETASFITKSVSDLTNYYLKSETYTQTEVNNLIWAIQQFHYEIYPNLQSVTTPASNVLYLIWPTGSGSDLYEEYVYTTQFVKIWETSIDLSQYVTITALNTALASYVTSTGLATILNDYVTTSGLSTTLADYVTNSSLATTLNDYATTTALNQALGNKLDKPTNQAQWTVWQVLVKTASASEWQDPPATWVISSNNTYKDIVHLSQAEFNNLGTYDPDTLYSTPEWEEWTFVDNTPFWSSWDWVTDKAPSMNAVYDVLWDVETLLANI